MKITILPDGKIQLEFDGDEAKGIVILEESIYGLRIDVNGRGIALLDLFYLSPEGQEIPDRPPHINLALFQNDTADGDGGDPLAYVRWHDDRVAIDYESPVDSWEPPVYKNLDKEIMVWKKEEA